MSIFKGLHICGPATNDYMRWEDESEKRFKRGERQSQCGGCGKWYWPSWTADVEKHVECKAPKCATCHSLNVIDITRKIGKRTAIVIGVKCLNCHASRLFKSVPPPI